eukprot:scaffold45980_cov33-Tisochrysis_lutea.AAC.3
MAPSRGARPNPPRCEAPPVQLHTPVGGENVYGFQIGDSCWFDRAEVEGNAAPGRIVAELLEVGIKPTIKIDEPATRSLCTQWDRLMPLICLGERCWYVVARGIGRGGVSKNRRVLAELQHTRPAPSIRPINSENSRTVSWSDLEVLNEMDAKSLEHLQGISEQQLARLLAAAAKEGCSISDVSPPVESQPRQPRGQRRAPSDRDRSQKLGRLCGTPGCALSDFHLGPCSTESNERKRR